ncbi:ASCH domain-containing protein [Cellulomonas sp. PhB143]|uniref:ASCH domain-containing protein n=1 Tax=Cellulomonas sp. PhB143 TaxID=2485186 RepID=UPI000F479B03|nr:ASCH domain-containing protein [Cellulomonas sp. PhB143]ROS73526.1 uncharacterized protein YhfF [Cellulomonas sp. PhB143]
MSDEQRDRQQDGAGHDTAADILEFWESARIRAGLVRTAAATGYTVEASMVPPAWSFGDDAETADALLEAVLRREKTATSSSLWEYEDTGEDLPEEKALAIVLDASGEPRALIRTESVDVVPFDEVGEEFAAAEGEGDRSLESWRTEHETFFRRSLAAGREFSPQMPVVCERFSVLFP